MIKMPQNQQYNRLSRRDFLLYSLLAGGAAACGKLPKAQRTPEAEEFFRKLWDNSNFFYDDNTRMITIQTGDGLEFKMLGRRLADGRVEVGYLNNTILTVKGDGRTYKEHDSNAVITGRPLDVMVEGQKPMPFYSLDPTLKHQFASDYNTKLKRLSQYIDQRVSEVAKR